MPLERDPEAVLRDVLNDKVSIENARLYGVVIDPDGMTLDHEATARLRARR